MSFWHDETSDNPEPRLKKASSLTDLTQISTEKPTVAEVETTVPIGDLDTIMGERISNILHRTYFTEHGKLLRGEPVDHPVLNSDIRRESGAHTFNSSDYSEKSWEDYFDKVIGQLPFAELRESSGPPNPQNSSLHPKEHSAKGGNIFACMDWDISTLEVISEDSSEGPSFRRGGSQEEGSTPSALWRPPSDIEDGNITSESDFSEDFQASKKPVLLSTSAKPFLGDDLSQHRGALFTRDMFHGPSSHTSGVKRVHSLTAIDKHRTLHREPCLLPMPTSPTGDLHDLFTSIPPHSWILPYVIAGAVILSADRKDIHRKNPSNVSLRGSTDTLSALTQQLTPPHDRRSGAIDDLRVRRSGPSPTPPLTPAMAEAHSARRSRSITVPLSGSGTVSCQTETYDVVAMPLGSNPLPLSPLPSLVAAQTVDTSPPIACQPPLHSTLLGSSFPPLTSPSSGEVGGRVPQARSADTYTEASVSHRFFSFGGARRREEDASMDDSHYRDKEVQGGTGGGSPGSPGKRFPSFGGLRRREGSGGAESCHSADSDKSGDRMNASPKLPGSSSGEKRQRGKGSGSLFSFGSRRRLEDPGMDSSHFEEKAKGGSSHSGYFGDGSGVAEAPLSTSPPVGLLGGLLQRMRSADLDDSRQRHRDREKRGGEDVHGDLVMSHDHRGVYLTSNPDHCASEASLLSRSAPSDAKDKDSIPRASTAPSTLPKFMQHLFVFPNFVKLGSVFICKTNPAWGTWEKRRIFLWDNYIFEALHDDDGVPVGFANLSGAIVEMNTPGECLMEC